MFLCRLLLSHPCRHEATYLQYLIPRVAFFKLVYYVFCTLPRVVSRLRTKCLTFPWYFFRSGLKVRERLDVVDATVELWMRRSAGMLSRGGSETDTDVLQVRLLLLLFLLIGSRCVPRARTPSPCVVVKQAIHQRSCLVLGSSDYFVFDTADGHGERIKGGDQRCPTC